MVVIAYTLWQVFWLDYRRYLRTRRYWILTLTTLILGWLMGGVLTLGAQRDPDFIAAFFSLRYTSPIILGTLAILPAIVAVPLMRRVPRDLYKNRALPDLYLTELHPLGIVLGRIGVVVALTGLSLTLLTPVALWVCLLMGTPLQDWLLTLLLALCAYGLMTASETYSVSGQVLEDSSPQVGMRLASSQTVYWLTTGAGGILMLLGAFTTRYEAAWGIPLWGFTPFTAPMLLQTVLHGVSVPPLILAAFACTGGFTLWFALAAAQRRDWWSERVYRLMRWGGTLFWLALIGGHAYGLARSFALNPASAERLLLLLILLTTELNLLIAYLTGYFAIARRPRPLPMALPYPYGALVWQWGLHWLSSGVLYLSIGSASGQWVSLEKWGFITVYSWAGGTLLPQAIYSAHWGFLARHSTPLERDYVRGVYINTRAARMYYENLAGLVSLGFFRLASLASFAVIGSWLIHTAIGSWLIHLISALFHTTLPANALAEWLWRVHPWWGYYQLWILGVDDWRYVAYCFGWVVLLVVVWGRVGWLSTGK